MEIFNMNVVAFLEWMFAALSAVAMGACIVLLGFLFWQMIALELRKDREREISGDGTPRTSPPTDKEDGDGKQI